MSIVTDDEFRNMDLRQARNLLLPGMYRTGAHDARYDMDVSPDGISIDVLDDQGTKVSVITQDDIKQGVEHVKTLLPWYAEGWQGP